MLQGDFLFSLSPDEDIAFYNVKYHHATQQHVYILEETPISKMIQQALPPYTQYRNLEQPLFNRVLFYANVMSLLILLCLVMVMIVQIVRYVI